MDVFLRFLNCANGTEFRKASRLMVNLSVDSFKCFCNASAENVFSSPSFVYHHLYLR